MLHTCYCCSTTSMMCVSHTTCVYITYNNVCCTYNMYVKVISHTKCVIMTLMMWCSHIITTLMLSCWNNIQQHSTTLLYNDVQWWCWHIKCVSSTHFVCHHDTIIVSMSVIHTFNVWVTHHLSFTCQVDMHGPCMDAWMTHPHHKCDVVTSMMMSHHSC